MATTLTGETKKFLKFSGKNASDENFSRTYSGLNLKATTSTGTAVDGMQATYAADFIAELYDSLTNTTYVAMYYGTEELINLNP